MNYGLTNRLLVRKDAEGEPQAGAPRELLNVSVRQSYYTDANASKFDPSYSYGYSNRAAKRVLADLAVGARDADRRRWRSTTASSTTRSALPDNPEAARHEPERHAARAEPCNVTGGWTRQAFTPAPTGRHHANNFIQTPRRTSACSRAGSAAASRSTTTSRARRCSTSATSASTTRSAAASRSNTRPSTIRTTASFLLPKDRRFNMSFTLAGVGSFSNFFGAFGGGTY